MPPCWKQDPPGEVVGSWTQQSGRAAVFSLREMSVDMAWPSGAAHPDLPGSGSQQHLSTVNTAAGQAISPEVLQTQLCPGEK